VRPPAALESLPARPHSLLALSLQVQVLSEDGNTPKVHITLQCMVGRAAARVPQQTWLKRPRLASRVYEPWRS
jgi:hypothetical protein